MTNRVTGPFTVIAIVLALLLSACGNQTAPPPTDGPAAPAAPTQAAAATAASTAVPTAAPTTAPTSAAPTALSTPAPNVVLPDITFPTIVPLPPFPTPQASLDAVGVGDSYYPLQGNPGYDAQRYTLEIAADPADVLQISATTTMEALASNELASFNLDFLGFEISAVTVDGTPASFSRDGQELTITPASPIAAGAPFTVVVSYAGKAERYRDPGVVGYFFESGWRTWDKGYLAAFSQPDGAMAWFPSNNTPRDKASYTFRITVDTPKMALASGVLREVIPVDTNTNTYVWEMSQPMSTQVVSVMVGEFELHESTTPGGIPIRNYFLPGTDPQTIASYEAINEQLDFLVNIFGPYPYEAYGHVTIPGFPTDSGYESQSLTMVSAEDETPGAGIHEMGHQWFGNALTVRDWKDIWLHEGFTRYIQALWAENLSGVDGYNEKIADQVAVQYWHAAKIPPQFGRPPLPQGQVLPAYDPGVEYMYYPSYTSGALTLHALRMEVGDEIFFKILPTFYQKYKDAPATTEDFIATAEELAGRDLSSVWDTWLYATTIPDITWLKEAHQYK